MRRERVAIRLPKWIILRLKKEAEIKYKIEDQLVKGGLLNLPDDYD